MQAAFGSFLSGNGDLRVALHVARGPTALLYPGMQTFLVSSDNTPRTGITMVVKHGMSNKVLTGLLINMSPLPSPHRISACSPLESELIPQAWASKDDKAGETPLNQPAY